MKKIQTLSDVKKSEKKKKLIVGIILIALMVFSTAGFAFNGLYGGGSTSNPSDETQYPYYNGQQWVFSSGGYEYYFANHVDDVNIETVSIEKSLSDYYGVNLYVDAENPSVLNELNVNLARFTGRFQEACYEECERDLPEKDCSENLIVWRQSEKDIVRQEDNCIFIEGDLKTVDAFLFKLLGIEGS